MGISLAMTNAADDVEHVQYKRNSGEQRNAQPRDAETLYYVVLACT